MVDGLETCLLGALIGNKTEVFYGVRGNYKFIYFSISAQMIYVVFMDIFEVHHVNRLKFQLSVSVLLELSSHRDLHILPVFEYFFRLEDSPERLLDFVFELGDAQKRLGVVLGDGELVDPEFLQILDEFLLVGLLFSFDLELI